jgi:hypothetical protein
MELRAPVDDAVQQGHRQADRDPATAGGQPQPAAGGAVQIDGVVDADVQRRKHPRLAVDHEADGTVIRLVEDGVRDRALVVHPAAIAGGGGAGRGGVEVGHRASSCE